MFSTGSLQFSGGRKAFSLDVIILFYATYTLITPVLPKEELALTEVFHRTYFLFVKKFPVSKQQSSTCLPA